MKKQTKILLATIPLAIASATGKRVDAIVDKEPVKIVEHKEGKRK